MSLALRLCSFALDRSPDGEAPHAADESLLRDLRPSLDAALRAANDRAWRALELALGGEPLLDRCRDSLAAADQRAFAAQIRKFVENCPLAALGAGERLACLRELQAAREAGRLSLAADGPASLARQPVSALADDLKACGCGALAALDLSLLVTAVRFFFRREVASDARLEEAMASARWQDFTENQQRGLFSLWAAMAQNARRLEELLAAHSLALETEEFGGVTLAARGGPLEPADALDLARRLAEDLNAAHRRGAMHGGVSPANVLVVRTPQGWRAKAVGFGPAGQGDRRADVRGFGRVVCFALFGTADPIGRHWRGTTPAIADWLDRCLEDDPDARFADFDAVLAALPEVTPKGEAEQAGPRLVVTRGAEPGVGFSLRLGRNVVGGADADVDLVSQEHPGQRLVSDRHCAVTRDRAGLSIEDLGSQHGTLVNRTRLARGERRTLKPGDRVQVGAVQMRVEGP